MELDKEDQKFVKSIERQLKGKTCPYCSSDKVAVILYGLPSFGAGIEKLMKENKLVLGGCTVSGEDHDLQCLDCEQMFSVKRPDGRGNKTSRKRGRPMESKESAQVMVVWKYDQAAQTQTAVKVIKRVNVPDQREVIKQYRYPEYSIDFITTRDPDTLPVQEGQTYDLGYDPLDDSNKSRFVGNFEDLKKVDMEALKKEVEKKDEKEER